MNNLFNRLGPLLRRTFHTNAFTTAGGLVCLLAVVLMMKHYITSREMLEMLGIGAGIIGFAAKDGARIEPVVAPEALTAPDEAGPAPAPPTGSNLGLGVVLLLGALLGVTACAPPRPSSAALPVQQLQQLEAALDLPADVTSSQHPDTAAPVASLPPYLVAPPEGLTKRQVRQFRRAQRRALIEASRSTPAKVKVTGGSAYAEPTGNAVALHKANAPVAAAPGSTSTDNTNLGKHANGPAATGHDFAGPLSGATAPPPQLTRWQQVLAFLRTSWYYLVALAVVTGVIWLRFGPVGRSILAAARAAQQLGAGTSSNG